MKKLYLLIFFCFIVLFSNGQNNILSKDSCNTAFNIETSIDRISLRGEVNFLSIDTISNRNGEFISFSLGKNYETSRKIAFPTLPTYYKLVEIPHNSSIEIRYNNVEADTIFLNPYTKLKVIPYQKSLSKSGKEEPFLMDKKIYSSNSYIGDDLISVENLGYKNNDYLARIAVSPIRYNPLNNSIIVVRSFSLEILFNEKRIEKTISTKANIPYTNRPLKMIILSDPIFKNVLKPFIKWKREKGFEIVELYKGENNVGNTPEQMREYLLSYYNSHKDDNLCADYLLICGDVEQIPAFAATTEANTYTDLYYGEYTNDFLPDLYYGRFSAQDTLQMKSIVEKTINYEKYLLEDTTFLSKTLLVAGKETAQTTITNAQINYLKRYLAEEFSVDTLIYYNPSSDNFASQIRDSISKNGYSLINYSAHCSSSGWAYPSLTSTNINSLSNYGKFPFYINNCCLAGKFDEGECFCESIIRADDKGGIGAIGASNNTYWREDYYWSCGNKSVNINPSYDANNIGAYDRWFHSHNESYDKWSVTMGQILQAGNLAVTQSNSELTNYYWEIYHLFGDPSLMPYLGTPLQLQVTFPDSISLGTSQITISAHPHSYVALSQNDVLLSACFMGENESLTLQLNSPINDTSSLMLVVTNQFTKPFIGTIKTFIPNEPFVDINTIKYFDENGEEVTKLKNNQEYSVKLMVKNFGSQPLDNVSLKTSSDLSLIFFDSTESIGQIEPNEEKTIVSAFVFRIEDGVRDRTELQYEIEILGDNNFSSLRTFSINVNSPKISIEQIKLTPVIEDEESNNEKTYDLSFIIRNIGRNFLSEGEVFLEDISSNVILEQENVNSFPLLQEGGTFPILFTLRVNESDLNDKYIFFKIRAVANQYLNTIIVDSIDVRKEMEDFETGDLSRFQWINISEHPWVIENQSANVLEGNYSLRSGGISDNEKTTLSLEINTIMNDSISFFLKTSTENGFDYFCFYIDGEQQYSSSGIKPWKKCSYPLLQGEHTLVWEYVKDISDNGGEDAVWIDNISLPLKAKIILNNQKTLPKDNISVYPTPANDIIYLKGLTSKVEVKIFDSFGRQVMAFDKRIINSIDVSKLLEGVYFLWIKTSNEIKTTKIIIAR
ncbi:MAG: C25 family cysteine peptidase [Bacteroidales bacterium]|jgi:hypothetical protein|nr:C25 family cysteine peptidase [Bacteroidales bacterium]